MVVHMCYGERFPIPQRVRGRMLHIYATRVTQIVARKCDLTAPNNQPKLPIVIACTCACSTHPHLCMRPSLQLCLLLLQHGLQL